MADTASATTPVPKFSQNPAKPITTRLCGDFTPPRAFQKDRHVTGDSLDAAWPELDLSVPL